MDLDVRSDETCALQIVPRIWPLDNEGRRVTDRFVGDPDPGRWWEICFADVLLTEIEIFCEQYDGPRKWTARCNAVALRKGPTFSAIFAVQEVRTESTKISRGPGSRRP